ncbi:unnamed protein product, partial [Gadus morhua 'NCC']
NFEVASSWATRQFGGRLRPETLDSVRDRLRLMLDAPGSRPPPAKPLPRRPTRVSGLFRRRTIAMPLWTSPTPSGTTPGHGFAQADAPRDAVPADTPLGSTRARPAFNTPAGDAVATPDTPTRRPS